MTARQALRQAEQQLIQAGVPDAPVDAAYLLAHVWGTSRLQALAQAEQALAQAEQAAFFGLVGRRAAREPLQYILGTQGFMGHTLRVAPQVLIPRADTETLAQQAILRLQPGMRVLDLCCGSGALALSLALACPQGEVWAGDIAPQAVELTQQNAAALGARVQARQGDFLAPFAGMLFDLIVCNPPYIPQADLAGLQQEVQREPRLALDGGPDGLSFYRRLFSQAPGYLHPGAWVLCELGDRQAQDVTKMAAPAFAQIQVYNDLRGLPRALACVWKG